MSKLSTHYRTNAVFVLMSKPGYCTNAVGGKLTNWHSMHLWENFQWKIGHGKSLVLYPILFHRNRYKCRITSAAHDGNLWYPYRKKATYHYTGRNLQKTYTGRTSPKEPFRKTFTRKKEGLRRLVKHYGKVPIWNLNSLGILNGLASQSSRHPESQPRTLESSVVYNKLPKICQNLRQKVHTESWR